MKKILPVNVTGTIYEKLLSASEKFEFRVIDDKLIHGGSELINPEWQKSYVYELFKDRQFYPFVFMTVQVTDDEWIGRFISFEYDMYRLVWISKNNKRCLNVLQEYQGIILN